MKKERLLPLKLNCKKTGERIDQVRREQHIPLEALLLACGIDIRSYYYWLSGRTRPSLQSLFAVSCATGVPVDDLLVFEQALPE